MRIITGSAKGVSLITLEGDATRPTSARAKEALFSMLQFDIEGRRVLDLFGGSGQLGLEALSRGAAFCDFVDASTSAAAIIRKNIAKTGFADCSRVTVADYRDFLRRVAEKGGYDLVFLDPPYVSDSLADALCLLAKTELLHRGCLVVCESEDGCVMDKSPQLSEKYSVIKSGRYGRVHIELLTPLGEQVGS